MAGRGNRSQGNASAHVIMTTDRSGKNTKAILSANSQENAGSLPEMLENLYNGFASAKPEI